MSVTKVLLREVVKTLDEEVKRERTKWMREWLKEGIHAGSITSADTVTYRR